MARIAWSLCFVLFAACGGNGGGSLICETTDPQPEACTQECEPGGDSNTCPPGFHCRGDGHCDAECTQGGSECGEGKECSPDGHCVDEGACFGLECEVPDCEAMGMSPTTLSGTVYAPNGTLPLAGINVYIPNVDPGPISETLTCDRCDNELAGTPVTRAVTDEEGHFTLEGIPSGTEFELITQSGKWRKRTTITEVNDCTDNAVPNGDTTLPSNSTLGDLPRIAISTGKADALECLFLKLGIDEEEIGTKGDPQRVHMYSNTDLPDNDDNGEGANRFANGFGGGSGNFADSQTELWDSTESLSNYDIVILSCEGDQFPGTKSQDNMDALEEYANLGGRVFASHWHNIWIEGEENDTGHAIAAWQPVADFTFAGNPDPDDLTASIDEVDNPKGASFATWMLNVMGSTVRGLIEVTGARVTCGSVDLDLAEQWVYLDPDQQGSDGNSSSMNFQFTTPIDENENNRCGKVVFSDMHVSEDSGSSTQEPFPNECSTDPLTPQEKALAYMLFDLASCVGVPGVD